ncbi:hypothetical protein QFZ27_002549 [Inquilinus ginsengisoli]|jgi:hypothetical protein|uniref:hypothetical protein n=1 Tax=Inquilinus ginsengisoli TaxID=363840 RepID=UPI003D23E849
MRPLLLPIVTLLAGAALLSACARMTEAGARQQLDRLIGVPRSLLIAHVGAPLREGRGGDGSRYAIFDASWVERGGGYFRSEPHSETVTGTIYDGRRAKDYVETRTVTVDRWVPPYAERRPCLVTFLFDAADRISSYAFRGNGCVAEELD